MISQDPPNFLVWWWEFAWCLHHTLTSSFIHANRGFSVGVVFSIIFSFLCPFHFLFWPDWRQLSYPCLAGTTTVKLWKWLLRNFHNRPFELWVPPVWLLVELQGIWTLIHNWTVVCLRAPRTEPSSLWMLSKHDVVFNFRLLMGPW